MLHHPPHKVYQDYLNCNVIWHRYTFIAAHSRARISIFLLSKGHSPRLYLSIPILRPVSREMNVDNRTDRREMPEDRDDLFTG